MDENEKIHVKLELCKDKSSGLTLIAHFDPNAPNFKKEGEKYTWFPNSKEKHFIKEAFDLISISKEYNPEEDNYLKFSNNQQTLDDPYTKEDNQENNNLNEETLQTENPVEIKTEQQNDNHEEHLNEKISISESDKQAIDDALEKQMIKEETLSENDKEKIIEKILNKKKENY